MQSKNVIVLVIYTVIINVDRCDLSGGVIDYLNLIAKRAAVIRR